MDMILDTNLAQFECLVDLVANQVRIEVSNNAYLMHLAYHDPKALVDELKEISHASAEEGAADLGKMLKG